MPAHLELLQQIPIFSPLPAPTLERLASELEARDGDGGHHSHPAGRSRRPLLRRRIRPPQVTVDGSPSGELGPGDSFGEIALLRDVPRTATVEAETDAQLLALGRDAFLDAVTGHPPSARAADAVVGARLGLATPD